MFLIVVLLSAILIGPSQAPYPPQKCFICEGDDCNSAKAQDCPTDLNDDKSGKAFVNKAFNANNAGATVAANYATFVNGLGFPTPPTWEQLTRYVCYTSQNNTRGCLVMGKGLCATDRTWLGTLGNLGEKIKGIMSQAANSVTSMFSDATISTDLSNENKTLISQWIATNYFAPLVNNTAADHAKLESCCEGDACNASSSPLIRQSMLSVCLSLVGFVVATI